MLYNNLVALISELESEALYYFRKWDYYISAENNI
jgi:hypothetical protein